MLEGMNAGADDYIAKSSDFEVLRARLRAQLRRKQFEDENRSIRDQLRTSELEAAESRARARPGRGAPDAARRSRAEERGALPRDGGARGVRVLGLARPARAVASHRRIHRVLIEDHASRLDDDGQRVAGVIRKNTVKMARLIEEPAEFSRASRRPVTKRHVDMTALARDVASEVIEPGRAIVLHVAELPPALADEALVRQVWVNVLSNAVKYTRRRERATIEIAAVTHGDLVVYTVRDNGVGFDPRYREKLFAVFQRLHSEAEFEGTGVGLALSWRIVKRHGGWMGPRARSAKVRPSRSRCRGDEARVRAQSPARTFRSRGAAFVAQVGSACTMRSSHAREGSSS